MSHPKIYHSGTSSMDFGLSRHHRAASASFNPQAPESESPAHMRFSSISSKGSTSDLSLLQTPQDTQNLQDSVIKPRVETASKLTGPVAPWQINTNNSTITSDVLTASPTDERPLSALKLKDKPIPSQLVTSFPNRTRPAAATAHPSQRAVFAPFTAGPRSASAVFATTPTTESPTQDQPVAQPEPVEPVPLSSQHRRTQSAPLTATPAGLQLEQQKQQHQQQQQQHQQHQQQQDQQYSMNFMQSHIPVMSRPEATVLPASYAPIPSPPMNGVLRHATVPQPPPQRVYSPPTSYNTMPAYPAVNFMPTPMPTLQPMMYPSYFPPAVAAATQPYYSPPPMPPKEPQTASPPPQPAATATVNSASAANQSPWKAINPNSQPQMPLSWLISQANGGFMVGGPSPHNRKAGLFKSELCRNWEEKRTCRYGLKCQFAHGEEELRKIPRHPKYKTEICRTFWVTGTCPYGKRCCFIHTDTTPATTPTTANPPVAAPANVPGFPKSSTGTNNDDDNVNQAVSLLARLDLKQRSTPDRGSTPSSSSALTRKTPDTDVSDPFSFVYPGSAKAVAATGA